MAGSTMCNKPQENSLNNNNKLGQEADTVNVPEVSCPKISDELKAEGVKLQEMINKIRGKETGSTRLNELGGQKESTEALVSGRNFGD